MYTCIDLGEGHSLHHESENIACSQLTPQGSSNSIYQSITIPSPQGLTLVHELQRDLSVGNFPYNQCIQQVTSVFILSLPSLKYKVDKKDQCRAVHRSLTVPQHHMHNHSECGYLYCFDVVVIGCSGWCFAVSHWQGMQCSR